MPKDYPPTGFEDPDIKQAGFDGVQLGERVERDLRQDIVKHPVSLDNWRQWRYFIMTMKVPLIELETRVKMCEDTANRKFTEDISKRAVTIP